MEFKNSVQIPSGNDTLNAFLNIPDNAKGIVIFAHGSGSSRHSTRNQYVAGVLNDHGFATVLADLLTEEEEVIDNVTREIRFNIPLLADRLEDIALWSKENEATKSLPIGLFGASTGAGAALIVAAKEPDIIDVVVSRGGRPDLAGEFLPDVKAPSLLIVGGNDDVVIGLNEEALEKLNDLSKLEIVPGATHLFEEPGTLERAANLAAKWFETKLK